MRHRSYPGREGVPGSIQWVDTRPILRDMRDAGPQGGSGIVLQTDVQALFSCYPVSIFKPTYRQGFIPVPSMHLQGGSSGGLSPCRQRSRTLWCETLLAIRKIVDVV